MKTIIAGSRNFYSLVVPGKWTFELRDSIDKVKMDALELCIRNIHWTITKVIHGGARGVDELGGLWAKKHGIPFEVYKPDWTDLGAGMRRNVEMAENAEALLAIWDGASKGTAHMIQTAKKRGMQLAVFKFHWVHDELTLYRIH